MKRIFSLSFFMLGACLLLSLCVWQIYRAQWKDEILEKLDEEYTKDVFGKELGFTDFMIEKNGDEVIHSGYIQGEFVHASPLFWPKTKDGSLGFYVMYPFMSEEGFPVLVNLGWVHEDIRTHTPLDNIEIPQGEPLKIGGVARVYDAGRWGLSNNADENKWYRYDTEMISEYLALNTSLPDAILFAKDVRPENILELGDTYGAEIYPRDTHYQYALFWFSLLVIWLVIIGRMITKKGQ